MDSSSDGGMEELGLGHRFAGSLAEMGPYHRLKLLSMSKRGWGVFSSFQTG